MSAFPAGRWLPKVVHATGPRLVCAASSLNAGSSFLGSFGRLVVLPLSALGRSAFECTRPQKAAAKGYMTSLLKPEGNPYKPFPDAPHLGSGYLLLFGIGGSDIMSATDNEIGREHRCCRGPVFSIERVLACGYHLQDLLFCRYP